MNTPYTNPNLITPTMEPHEHQGKKRKDGGRVPSTKREQNKRRNLGPKKLDARRAELENQFENMGVWPQDQSSDTSEYTPERRRREEAQLEEAILVFGPKIEREGREQDYPNELFVLRECRPLSEITKPLGPLSWYAKRDHGMPAGEVFLPMIWA